MPRARLVFDGDGVYTEKEARIHKLTQETENKIDNIPGVVDDANSDSTTDALSAHMGKVLQNQINNLAGVGTFLSNWDCTTGLPESNPQEDPYTYKPGNYYIVSKVADLGGTNYKPYGATYTQGIASTAIETGEISMNDWYIYDGSQWLIQPAGNRTIVIDDALSPTSRNAVENRAVYSALSQKQGVILDLGTIREGAAAGATALQPGDNITELTNNAGYQTAGDVAAAIETLAPHGVGEGILTLQKNSSTIDTFSANASQDKTINISVPTTVAELSDANDYATKDYVDGNVIHRGTTAPSNPTEGMLWYDTTNDILKVYDGTNWIAVGDDNIKVFYLSSTSDTTNAQAAYDWFKAGKAPMIIYTPDVGTTGYSSTGIYRFNRATDSNRKLEFYSDLRDESGSNTTVGGRRVRTDYLNIITNGTTVTSITRNTSGTFITYLSTSAVNNDYTPSSNYDPATKKYVDDTVTSATEGSKYVGPTAPSSPVEGMLWYDTTNDILKVYNGTSWEIVGEGDMNYSDFNFQSKSGATVTLDLSNTITPSADFTVNAPSEIKDGQRYILRVSNGNIAYTMTLGTNITNPYGVVTTLTSNGLDQFVFLAIGGNLELQPEGGIGGGEGMEYVTQTEYDNLPSSKETDGKSYFIYSGHGSGIVDNTPFGSSWDGDTTHAPSKNAIYDVLGDVETLLANL